VTRVCGALRERVRGVTGLVEIVSIFQFWIFLFFFIFHVGIAKLKRTPHPTPRSIFSAFHQQNQQVKND
jgi:hypothetical protein